MKKITIYILFIALSLNSFAAKDSNPATLAPSTVDKTNVGSCNPSISQYDLDINNIRATLLGGGDFWWDGVNSPQYEYPKIDQTTGELSKSVLFSGALWFTGLDDGGNLRCASQTYRNQGHDFWTGPLEIGGNIPDDVCSDFDHHFEVLGSDIDAFRNAFNAGPLSATDIDESILLWPGKGNVHLQNHPTRSGWYFNNGSLAPFFDFNGDGIYNPVDGDYPIIKPCPTPNYADQMIFWVINDNGNSHGRSNGAEMGVQINCLAFAFQTSDELNDMTFYSYEILKKTAGNLTETFMGVFVDPDLGNALDDFIGCDTARSIGYCYNADNDDPDYNAGPPIVAIDYFEGPLADDSTELGMSSFVYFNNASGAQSDPDDAPQFRNYQTSKWKDGTDVTYGGTGYGGAIPTDFVYPDNPSTGLGWSECSNGNTADDRRFVQNSGPFTLTSAQSQRISIGVMVVETDPNTYNGCPDIEFEVGAADDKAQLLFDKCFGLDDGPDAPDLVIREMSNQLVINLSNAEGSNNYGENYSAVTVPTAIDSNFNFEGYIVYQLVSDKVTAIDLGDPAKAKIISQSDIKNNVINVFDYNLDPLSGLYVPNVRVQGNNEGTQKSIIVTDDQFADGESGLVNYKKYYFAVVAYAYNNHEQFDPALSNSVSAQMAQFQQGRKNFNIYSGIPHNVESEVGGTILNSEYGQGVVVKRLEGEGNGGKELELTQSSIDKIIQNNFVDVLEYEPNKDPIGFKIIDPLKVQNVDFELLIKNDGSTIIDDNAIWEVIVSEPGGAVIETISSIRNIDRPYDQILEDYGILINVGKPLPVNFNWDSNEEVFDYITSSISYTDESQRWLGFVADGSNGADLSPSNWIRSGNFKNNGYLTQVYDAHQYDNLAGANNSRLYDEAGIFTTMVDGGFAPYSLTANYRKPKVVVETPGDLTVTTPFSVYGPAFVWDRYEVGANDSVLNPINTLENMQSVNIVLTSNKDLWSRCVVFETGEDENFNIGGSRKGQIRNQTSIDQDGNEITGTTGFSYFPGYAINIETGERLNIAFGESSQRVDNNGDDMIWNPTSKLYDNLTDIAGTTSRIPVFGGKHFIYVFDTRYDECTAIHTTLTDAANFNMPAYVNQTNANTHGNPLPTAMSDLYKQIMYTCNPHTVEGFELLSIEDGLIPNDVEVKIRVEKPYELLTTTETGGAGSNASFPRYAFSTDGLAPSFNQDSIAVDALDNIRVVPNPYYAYSSYEVSPNSNEVKITNLPDVCTVSIFTVDGKLVRRYDRAVGDGGSFDSNRQDLSLGQTFGVENLNNSLNWNLKNHKDILVASGTYLIYVNAPDIGEKVVKSVVFVRTPDVTNF